MDWSTFFSVLLAIWVACTCYTIPLAYHSLQSFLEKKKESPGAGMVTLGFLFVLASGPFLIGVFHREIREGTVP